MLCCPAADMNLVTIQFYNALTIDHIECCDNFISHSLKCHHIYITFERIEYYQIEIVFM